MKLDQKISALAQELVTSATERKLTIATAESCTGGLIASAITSVAGSSSIFDRGFVTYSYESKTEELCVCSKLLQKMGAVSKEVAIEMAIGAAKRAKTDITISVTGIAGPTGATETKPVGLVYMAVYNRGSVETHEFSFAGDRQQVRQHATLEGLKLLKAALTHL